MVNPEKAKRRLPKYDADPERYRAQFGGFRLTERDLQILLWVHSYRYVWVDHVQALLGGVPGASLYQVPRRLQALFHHGYLHRLVPMSRMRLEKGSPKTVYTLDTKGARLLEEKRRQLEREQGMRIEPIQWRKAHTRRTEFFVEHQVETATFHACLEVALRGRGDLALLEWRQDAELQASFRYRAGDTGKVIRAGVKPDAYFAVQEGDHRRNFFLEVDRGTMEHRRLQEKFQTYYNYVRSGTYQERFAGKTPEDVRVLVVTTPGDKATVSHKRGETEPRTRFERMTLTLAAIRARQTGLGLFWFSTLDAYSLTEPDQILGPIWQRLRLQDGNPITERRALFF